MNKRKLRIGAVGLGRAFSLMLPTFVRHPLVEMVAGADPRADAQAKFAQDFGGRGYDGIEALCDDPNVEAVYICTPHEMHADQVCYAASKGKHIRKADGADAGRLRTHDRGGEKGERRAGGRAQSQL